jgi:carboxylesterase
VDAAVSTPGAEPWSAVGQGPRGRTGVLVIHGFTSSPIATRPLGQHLAAEGYAVEVVLLPGHGTSHRQLALTGYRDWYEAVDRVVDRLHVRCDAVVLIGHSMGGAIALDLAARRSTDIDAVVVINPVVRRPPGLLPRLSGLLQYVAPYLPRDLVGLPTDDIAIDGVEEGAYALVPARAARSLLLELDRVRAGLLDVVAPLLVVRSPDDHTVDPGNALEVLELAGSRDLRTLVCHDSYHVPQLDRDAALLTGTISDFLDDVVGSST